MIIFGIIIGLLIAIFLGVIMIYFRRVVEAGLNTADTQIGLKGPRQKGAIYMPPSEADEVRENIIARNSAKGRVTHVNELQ